MGMLFQAAAGAAFTFALAMGSPGYQGAAVASIWPTLSNDQREFIELVLSKEGQEVVVKDGYIPLPARNVERIRTLLGMEQE